MRFAVIEYLGFLCHFHYQSYSDKINQSDYGEQTIIPTKSFLNAMISTMKIVLIIA